MSAEIIKTYKQEIPALRFIGKKYDDNDRIDGTFGKHWGDWFQNGWFNVIEKQIDGSTKTIYEDGDAYIGLEKCKEGEPFEYWIGMLAPENTSVPEGYVFYDFPKGSLGVCWVCGKEDEVFMQEENCMKKLAEEGYNFLPDENGFQWLFERYERRRYTSPDEKGNIILDICFYVK
jgi:predicted transcriptional regulator YdeE